MICGGIFDLEMSPERVWGLSYHQMARKALSILSKRRAQLGEMTDLNACPKTPPVSVPEVVSPRGAKRLGTQGALNCGKSRLLETRSCKLTCQHEGAVHS